MATICAFPAISGRVAIPGAISSGIVAILGATIIGALIAITGASIIGAIIATMDILGNIPGRLIIEAPEVSVILSG